MKGWRQNLEGKTSGHREFVEDGLWVADDSLWL